MNNQGDRQVSYPLGETQPDRIQSHTGVRFEDITLEAVREGRVESDDLTIHEETLQLQAEAAAAAGYRQLASNLRRAAELVQVPNERLLEIYEALRPRRSTYRALVALSEELESKYGAVENARFVRQAADVYRDQGLLQADDDIDSGLSA